MDRRPKAKRRFNVLRDKAAVCAAGQRRRFFLAPLVLCSAIPLAGIWQIQSDLDPALNQPRIGGQSADLNDFGSLGSDPFSRTALAPNGVENASGPTHPATPLRTEAGSGSPGRFELICSGMRGDDMRADLPGLSKESTGGRTTKDAPRTEDGASRQAAPRVAPTPTLTQEQTLYRRAQGYHRQKALGMAAELYRMVLRENPAHRDALFHLASLYMEQSAYARAYPLVLDLVTREPDSARALVNLAIAEIGLSRPEKALAHLDRTLALEDSPRFRVYFLQGVALSRLQRPEEALASYRKSEDLHPGHGPLLFNMAVTYDRLERYGEALDLYARFLLAGESSSPRERREVQARIGTLMAYLAGEPEPSSGRGAAD